MDQCWFIAGSMARTRRLRLHVSSKGAENDRLLDHIYDIAVAPERFEQLVDSWVQRLGRQRDSADFGIFVDPVLLGHVERAERVLRELIDSGGIEGNVARDWADGVKSAAIVVNRSGAVIAANEGARNGLGFRIGDGLQRMPVVAADLPVLISVIASLSEASDQDHKFIRLQLKGGASPVLIRLVNAAGGIAGHTGVALAFCCGPKRCRGNSRRPSN